MKTVVITGVSTGIGYDAARWLVHCGYVVYGSVRSNKDADRVKNALGDNFRPLIFDVTDSQAIQQAVKTVEKELPEGEFLTGLVNNAGIFVGGPITETPLELFHKQFDVNFFGLVDVTKSFLPLLGAKKGAYYHSKIINISSISGHLPLPFAGAYASSKFALEAFSISLRRELLLYGIDVVVIAPGPIKTPIWDKQENKETMQALYKTDYKKIAKLFEQYVINSKRTAIAPVVISKKIQYILETKKTKTRYVISSKKWTDTWIPKFLPNRMMDKIIGKKLKLLPQNQNKV